MGENDEEILCNDNHADGLLFRDGWVKTLGFETDARGNVRKGTIVLDGGKEEEIYFLTGSEESTYLYSEE